MKHLMISLFVVLGVLLTAQSYKDALVRVSVRTEKASFKANQLFEAQVFIENVSKKDIRVPRNFTNTLGAYPSVRPIFVDEGGTQIYTMGAEAWPTGSTLKKNAVEKSTISLPPSGIFGRKILAQAPNAYGCYQLFFVLESWKSAEEASLDSEPILLGEVRSEMTKVCVAP